MGGLMTALHLAPHGKVVLATKRTLADCNTNFAQGGICCVASPDDSFKAHMRDTQVAGAGLCTERVVARVVAEAPKGIADLIRCGVKFTKKADGSWDLTREGGHSARRIFHAGDITGEQCEAAMIRTIRRHTEIDIREHAIVIDLITTTRRLGMKKSPHQCVGAYVLDTETHEIYAIRSPNTILATGGCGKVYLYTCNPDTEAVRGEGAVLVGGKGRPFMEKYDPRGSLAPRDIVARSIDSEMKRTGAPCMFLDIRSKGKVYLKRRFPNIYRKCLSFGIDMAKDLIPVVPAAHYCCGGIKATVDGRTSVKGLSAVGECASTGLHGANRLASNSLMEALVCARLTAKRLMVHPVRLERRIAIPAWKTGKAVAPDEAVLVAHMWDEIRRLMWDYVGIVRTDKRLARARRRLRTLRREIHDYYFRYLVTPDTLELRNLAVCAELIVKSAQKRRESRGLHYTLDCPKLSERVRPTILPGYRG